MQQTYFIIIINRSIINIIMIFVSGYTIDHEFDEIESNDCQQDMNNFDDLSVD